MWKTAASPASDAQVCPDFLQTLISVYDLPNPSDPLPLPCCSFYQPLSLWSPSGSAVRAAMRVGHRPNFGKQEASGNTGKQSCFHHLIRARCTDCVRARRRRGRIHSSVWRSDSHSHQQVRDHRSSPKKRKAMGEGWLKKGEGETDERRAGCSRSSAAWEEVSRPVAMAAGHCNKHETKSVPAKLPWQLSARASARLSWRVSFGLSYCDSRLGKVIGGSVSFHRRGESRASGDNYKN